MSYIIRTARIEDITAVKRIADSNKREIGFIVRPILEASIESGELLVAHEENGEVIGFLRWHRRRDGWSTIYEICVRADFRGLGIGKCLLNHIPRPIRLKCPVDNDANVFYERLGLTHTETESGRKRKLNIWMLTI